MNMQRYNNFLFIIPAVFSILAIIALVVWPPKLGIDLVGGSQLQIAYTQTVPSVEQIQTAIAPLRFGAVMVQPTDANAYILRLQFLSPDQKQSLETALATLGPIQEQSFTSIGPSIGAELLQKGLIAFGLVILCIIIFIAFAFRQVSKPVASWKYGVVAIVTLLHDVLIPVGVFALLGHLTGAEIDSLFIVALLTIFGISINDKIVVFDRIRENLRRNEERHKEESFSQVVGHSIMQTLARSINTSLTVVIMLLALYFLGPASTKTFALTLTVGMIAGTYSSMLLACPLLVVWERVQRKPGKRGKK